MGTPTRKIKRLPPIDQCLRETAIEYDLDPVEWKLLKSVPLRGTQHWEAREQLREKCRCKCLSWGGIK